MRSSGTAGGGARSLPEMVYGCIQQLARSVERDKGFYGYGHTRLSKIYGYGSRGRIEFARIYHIVRIL
jgi:hypothetical protein